MQYENEVEHERQILYLLEYNRWRVWFLYMEMQFFR